MLPLEWLSMSQDGKRDGPRTRGKSPSRIPVLIPSPGTTGRKRPANVLMDHTDGVGSRNVVATTPATPLTGLRRLEAMAKADVRNRNILSPRQTVVSKNGNPWVEKHLPKSLEDLFVHKKKVEEMLTWMSRVLTPSRSRVVSPL